MVRTISTNDKLEYQFVPASHGIVQFRVKAENDAHVALTTEPNESDHMFEVFIGGWENTKSTIRKNRKKPDVAEMSTPDILSGSEPRGFWIKWEDHTLTVGKENEHQPFLSYTNDEPLAVGYFGVSTGWGATGEWIIEEGKHKTQTPYKFYPKSTGGVLVKVKAETDAHIVLAETSKKTSKMYKIILGGWDNKASIIRYVSDEPAKSENSGRNSDDEDPVNTPNLLSKHELKDFMITWNEGIIQVRECSFKGRLIMEKTFPEWFGVSYIGVGTAKAPGKFEVHPKIWPALKKDSKQVSDRTETSTVGEFCWCDAVGGEVPAGAVEGGKDGEPLFVGRARHEGALIPGKVKPSHSVCYVAWGGQEHGKTEYQVLCGCVPAWVPTSGNNIPPTAVPAGETEDGETLYVGRVNHEDTVTIGKVQPSHNVCYIPFGGSEVAFPDYEIMVSQ